LYGSQVTSLTYLSVVFQCLYKQTDKQTNIRTDVAKTPAWPAACLACNKRCTVPNFST